MEFAILFWGFSKVTRFTDGGKFFGWIVFWIFGFLSLSKRKPEYPKRTTNEGIGSIPRHYWHSLGKFKLKNSTSRTFIFCRFVLESDVLVIHLEFLSLHSFSLPLSFFTLGESLSLCFHSCFCISWFCNGDHNWKCQSCLFVHLPFLLSN